MARKQGKQGKKGQLAKKSVPAQQASNTVPVEESPEISVETAESPDKHRRTSILITGGEQAIPRNKSIDDVISSTARMSAVVTDDKILKRPLVCEGTGIETQRTQLEVTEDKQAPITEDTVLPNQFEETIKDNKLAFEKEPSVETKMPEEPVLSPTATENDNKQLYESKENSLIDSSSDPQNQNAIEEQTDIDPVTLVGDKRKSELQEFIPQVQGEDEERNDFEPTQDELTQKSLQEKDLKTTKIPSEIENNGLPWESESSKSEKLPWETNNTDPNESNALPWDTENTDEQVLQDSKDDSHKSEKLPWETNDTNPNEGNAMPWDTENTDEQVIEENKDDSHDAPAHHDVTQSNVKPQYIQNTSMDELFGETNDNDFLSQLLGNDASDQKLLLSHSEDVSNSAHITQDPNLKDENESEFSQLEKERNYPSSFNVETNIADQFDSDSKINEGEADSKLERRNSLDDLLQDDKHEFLHENEVTTNDSEKFKFPTTENIESNSNAGEKGTENKSLDFLELDDDLLDDDFLEEDDFLEDNKNQGGSENLPQKSQSQPYSPIPVAVPFSNSSSKEPSTAIPSNKNKNDAYDFPDNLLAQKFKPAARSTNKYAPSTTTSKPALDPRLPPKSSTSPSAKNNLHVPSTELQSLANKNPPQPQQTKSFFEDLPIPMQKQPVKPARAALSKAQANQNISPIVNPAQPQVQKPLINPYAKPAMNTVISPKINYSQSAIPPTSNSLNAPVVPPPGIVGQQVPPQPSQYSNNSMPQPQPQPFPSMQNPSLGLKSNTAPVRKVSNPSPNLINTTLPKVQGSQSANSPYVPNAGPYAPSSHKRTLSRASSLIGAKGKEINPYAPAPGNSNSQQSPIGIANQSLMPNSNSPVGPSATVNNTIHGRRRGVSNVKSSFYHKDQIAPKVENPNALLQRQFPIFNWSSSKNVAYLVPSKITNTYGRISENIVVNDIKAVLNESQYLSSFPGPLNKTKSKKKDVEKWLESYSEFLQQDSGRKQEEIILIQVLLALVKHNGDFKSDEFTKDACAVLNPSIDYKNVSNPQELGNSISVMANAYKLDNAGINVVWSLLQVGNTERALEFCLSKGDWALALMVASFEGPEKFGKIAADYARASFPYQKSQSKVHHLMPIMLKLFSGNYKSAIDDITNVQSEGEWSLQHWRDLVSLVVINKPRYGNEFLWEFSKLLALSGQIIESQICLILTGLPLSNIPSLSNGVVFSVIGFGSHSFVYSEIYEYLLLLSSTNVPSTGFVHLLPLKLKHAQVLADYGLFTESQKYCDTISTLIKATGRSSFFSPVAFQEFQNLLMRISQSGSTELGWFGSKKLNLDKMWDQLDKFIGGDESKSKQGENGVFSNFSPSVSRAPSSLDITSMHNYPQTLPHVRTDHVRDPLISTNSAPATSSDNTILKLSGLSNSRPPLSVYSNNSTTSILKYAPASTLAFTKPGVNRNEQQNASPQQMGNPAFESLQQSRMAPSINSSQYVPLSQNQNENTYAPNKTQSKYSQNPQKMYSAGNGSFSYMNSSAQFSNLSIASHLSLHMSMPVPNPGNPMPAKRPSITNSFSENHVNSILINTHKHSSSLQSDISLDYPSEFKSTQKNLNDISSTEIIPEDEPGNQLKEENEKSPANNDSEKLEQVPGKQSSFDTVRGEAIVLNDKNESTDTTSLPPPPPKGISKSTPSVPGSTTRKPRARANPYAPGAAASRTSNSKTGSLASNKYASIKKEGDSLLVNTPSDVSYNDIFNYGGYQVPEKVEASSDRITESNNDNEHHEDKVEENKVSLQSGLVAKSEPNPVVMSEVLPRNTNVDDSFDMENVHENDIETSTIRNPNPRVPLTSSYKANQEESMFHPYQEDSRERRISNFGMDSSFGDFPIPGSPDLTTRANSVIGGTNGLFSSRLSQSQQSALYQQYEVQDDTVQDYIPVVDEEEEDSDDETLKEEKKKKEEERQRKIEQDRARQKQDISTTQRNQRRWFGNLLGNRNDDKPKPIRAKMGEKSSFVYDEKLKRWINKAVPLEEQLKSSAPPPPPSAKKKAVDSSSSSIAKPPTPNKPAAVNPESAPPVALANNSLSSGAPSKPASSQPPPGPPSSAGPSLANAGLDDLLSLGGGPTAGRKSKKGPRRGYVNLLDQK